MKDTIPFSVIIETGMALQSGDTIEKYGKKFRISSIRSVIVKKDDSVVIHGRGKFIGQKN